MIHTPTYVVAGQDPGDPAYPKAVRLPLWSQYQDGGPTAPDDPQEPGPTGPAGAHHGLEVPVRIAPTCTGNEIKNRALYQMAQKKDAMIYKVVFESPRKL